MGPSGEVQRLMLCSGGHLGHAPPYTGSISGVRCPYSSHSARKMARFWFLLSPGSKNEANKYVSALCEPYSMSKSRRALLIWGLCFSFSFVSSRSREPLTCIGRRLSSMGGTSARHDSPRGFSFHRCSLSVSCVPGSMLAGDTLVSGSNPSPQSHDGRRGFLQ